MGFVMSVKLLWLDPNTEEHKEITLPLPCVIGRSSQCHLKLEHKNISRQHARLEIIGHVLTIRNLSKNNHVRAHRKKCQLTSLDVQDEFFLDTIRFQVELLEEPSELKQIKVITHHMETKEKQSQVYLLPMTIGRHSQATMILPGSTISREQAHLLNSGGAYFSLEPKSQSIPTYLNGTQLTRRTSIWPGAGDVVQIDKYQLTFAIEDRQNRSKPDKPTNSKTTVIFDIEDDNIHRADSHSAPTADFPPAFFQGSPTVSYEALQRSGFPIDQTTYLAIGGGIGSFIWVDNLLTYGVPRNQIVSIGLHEKPYSRYQTLCQNSQIPNNERLRSNSDSCPDNLWGWPGYAVREAWRLWWQGQVRESLGILFQIFMEPLVDTYTPKSVDVFNSIDRESNRIHWSKIFRKGSVRAIRKLDDGRYVIAYSDKRSPKHSRNYRFVIASYIHLAVGYPGIRLVSDLEDFRAQTKDDRLMVSAYEKHDDIYESLKSNGGTIIIRGNGIVASRIVQRVYETRRYNENIRLVHLIRTRKTEGNRYQRSQRLIKNNWEFQPFNWPKSAWGGTLRVVLENAPEEERKRLLSAQAWGGTTTADRKDWIDIVSQGLAEGWYTIQYASIGDVSKASSNTLNIQLKSTVDSSTSAISANFIVDATGLLSNVTENPLLRDLFDTYQLPFNVQKRIKVKNNFEIEGMETHQNGHMYASGAMTLGGPYAPVDSFLGLQYTAQRSIEHLIAIKAPYIQPLPPLRSFGQWIRWAQGVTP